MVAQKNLTLQELKNMKACRGGIIVFKRCFGQEAKILDVADKLDRENRREWAAWLLAQKPELTLGLLKCGINVNVDFGSALSEAIDNGREEVVKILLVHGAVIRDHDWWLAVRTPNYKNIIKIMCKSLGDKEEKLEWIDYHTLEEIKKIINKNHPQRGCFLTSRQE